MRLRTLLALLLLPAPVAVAAKSAPRAGTRGLVVAAAKRPPRAAPPMATKRPAAAKKGPSVAPRGAVREVAAPLLARAEAKRPATVQSLPPLLVRSQKISPFPSSFVGASAKNQIAPKVAPGSAGGAAKGRLVAVRERPRGRSLVPRPPRQPPVSLYLANLRQQVQLRPFDEKDRPRKAAMKEFETIMRDHHTGRRHRMDPRLARALYQIARHYGSRLEIYSGYRPPAYSSRKHSRHLTGAAVDFRVVGVRNEALIKYLRETFHPAGVGYYPNGIHVHFDVDRQRDTYWVDAGDAPAAPSDGKLPSAPPIPEGEEGEECPLEPGVAAGALPDPAAGPATEPDFDDDPGFLR